MADSLSRLCRQQQAKEGDQATERKKTEDNVTAALTHGDLHRKMPTIRGTHVRARDPLNRRATVCCLSVCRHRKSKNKALSNELKGREGKKEVVA
mmetsp:Transcript_41430/g.81713  ORF Transcript_41430/g.81713 Transcript_41430/m.81713 type:complete len:95 (+) Transcript_41430:1846-2130(+)